MYVLKNDYRGRITTTLLDMLIAEDPDDIIAAASKTAEDTLRSMCGALYDIDGELAKTGAARNGYVLSMALSIALYNVYQIADEETVPEKVIKNYDDTMDDLVKIAKGNPPLNLPPAPVDNSGSGGTDGSGENAGTSGTGLRRMGSAPKRTHRI